MVYKWKWCHWIHFPFEGGQHQKFYVLYSLCLKHILWIWYLINKIHPSLIQSHFNPKLCMINYINSQCPFYFISIQCSILEKWQTDITNKRFIKTSTQLYLNKWRVKTCLMCENIINYSSKHSSTINCSLYLNSGWKKKTTDR